MVIGCGVVGAAIAYELSLRSDVQVMVLDPNPPAYGFTDRAVGATQGSIQGSIHSSTGAALGIAVGIISHKVRGRAWQLRRDSVERYGSLLAELRSRTNLPVPSNENGLLHVLWEGDDRQSWDRLIATRREQGFHLEFLEADSVCRRYPYLNPRNIIGAIYSPQDRQIDPIGLTQALVAAASQNGVDFRFGTQAHGWADIVEDEQESPIGVPISTRQHSASQYLASQYSASQSTSQSASQSTSQKQVRSIFTTPVFDQSRRSENDSQTTTPLNLGLINLELNPQFDGEVGSEVDSEAVPIPPASRPSASSSKEATPIHADWFVIAAGLGSTSLTAQLHQTLPMQAVLGQGIHLQLAHPLADPLHQPVISVNDVHVVPLPSFGGGEYWVGATVEFPPESLSVDHLADWSPDGAAWHQVWDRAIALCPGLAGGTVVRQWWGLRPRPVGQGAPVIGPLPGFKNVLLATGHYRNGVLLAPATALAISGMIPVAQ